MGAGRVGPLVTPEGGSPPPQELAARIERHQVSGPDLNKCTLQDSSRASRQRCWPFWTWLALALLGEIGLALVIIGPLVQSYLLWALAGLAGVAPAGVATFSFGWFVAAVGSVLALVAGLRGLAHEQRDARGVEDRSSQVRLTFESSDRPGVGTRRAA
jgi:hypothetical protein